MENSYKYQQEDRRHDYQLLKCSDYPVFAKGASFAVAIDTRIYEIPAILRASYRFTDRFAIFLSPASVGNLETIYLFATAFDPEEAVEMAPGELLNELLDQALRCRLDRELRPICEILTAKAFAEGNLLP